MAGDIEQPGEAARFAVDGLPLSRFDAPAICQCSARSAWKEGDGQNPLGRRIPFCLDCSAYILDEEVGRTGHVVVPASSSAGQPPRWSCLSCDLTDVSKDELRQRTCPRSGAPDQVFTRQQHRDGAHKRMPLVDCGLCRLEVIS